MLKILIKHYPENIKKRYKLDNLEYTEIEIMEQIGFKRGSIITGGKVCLEKTANIILDDFRSGKIGKITLEKLDEI